MNCPARREGDEVVCPRCFIRWSLSEDRPECTRRYRKDFEPAQRYGGRLVDNLIQARPRCTECGAIAAGEGLACVGCGSRSFMPPSTPEGLYGPHSASDYIFDDERGDDD